MEANEPWFHGSLTRSQAEAILLPDPKGPGPDGTFLVRTSETSPGDFVLSVLVHVAGPQVIHYQIRRHGVKDEESCLFSLAEKQSVVIQGLDELLRYYRYHPNNGLQHPLSSPVPGTVSPPPEILLHGTENLLHRAAANGELTIVSELLKSGYRNVSAKNHDGQTATHLAAFYGFDQVIRELHKYGAPVNVADSSGYSPLHFACQANHPDCVKALLEVGADPTNRNQITGWVPLHEAAWKGYTICCQTLIDFGSPVHPRTPKNETPGDIARANSHIALANMLDSYKLQQAKSTLSSWYHPDIDRTEAIHRLDNFNHGMDGTFLIRNSQKKPNTYVLTLCYEKMYHHFEIFKKGVYYFLKEGPYLASLEHVVDHYTRFSDGLPLQLRIPVPPPDGLPERKMSLTALPRINHQKDRIPLESIQRNKVIGGGEFGLVYQGVYQSEEGTKYSVAIKVLNDMGERQTKDFLREANVMMSLDHPCVVQLIGISCGPPILMVLELVPLGSLLEYLIDQKSNIQCSFEIALWAGQIASGMVYLSSKKFVHRDLAARNILLASKFQAKISDFGLSRSFAEDKDYYKASEGGRWPLRWYAPECINYGTFSSASDVWSYGILLWEMYSFGKTPYESMNGTQTIQFVEEGKRLERPSAASEDIYNIMKTCWKYKASERPTFNELFRYYSKCSDYMNIKELTLPSKEE